METDKNLTHIREARKAAYNFFVAFEEEEKNRKSRYFWKNIAKFFFYSIFLLAVIISIAKFLIVN